MRPRRGSPLKRLPNLTSRVEHDQQERLKTLWNYERFGAPRRVGALLLSSQQPPALDADGLEGP